MYATVRAEMARKKVTLDVLSKKLGCTIGTLSLKLNGKAPITLEEALQIKEALGASIPLEDLFKSEEGEPCE